MKFNGGNENEKEKKKKSHNNKEIQTYNGQIGAYLTMLFLVYTVLKYNFQKFKDMTILKTCQIIH